MPNDTNRDLRYSLQTSSSEFAQLWSQICQEHEQQEKAWIADLRKEGFAAAHPNDGWVKRDRSAVTFVYPQYNDGTTVGSKVMLGRASDPRSWRAVEVVEIGWRNEYTFKDIPLPDAFEALQQEERAEREAAAERRAREDARARQRARIADFPLLFGLFVFLGFLFFLCL